ncbi:hypothetical protein JZ751_024261 [Albula glossodonta]|uniref:Uncharacterized protein n=1 Tax=Albula glossodonta TaxID=121402 RepID=A0A8T2NEV1_9TELE|nr:hypothetical protein JZ751_024261 [Albula glossodonta]
MPHAGRSGPRWHARVTTTNQTRDIKIPLCLPPPSIRTPPMRPKALRKPPLSAQSTEPGVQRGGGVMFGDVMAAHCSPAVLNAAPRRGGEGCRVAGIPCSACRELGASRSYYDDAVLSCIRGPLIELVDQSVRASAPPPPISPLLHCAFPVFHRDLIYTLGGREREKEREGCWKKRESEREGEGERELLEEEGKRVCERGRQCFCGAKKKQGRGRERVREGERGGGKGCGRGGDFTPVIDHCGVNGGVGFHSFIRRDLTDKCVRGLQNVWRLPNSQAHCAAMGSRDRAGHKRRPCSVEGSRRDMLTTPRGAPATPFTLGAAFTIKKNKKKLGKREEDGRYSGDPPVTPGLRSKVSRGRGVVSEGFSLSKTRVVLWWECGVEDKQVNTFTADRHDARVAENRIPLELWSRASSHRSKSVAKPVQRAIGKAPRWYLDSVYRQRVLAMFINARRRIVQPMIDQSNRAGKSTVVTVFKSRRRKPTASHVPGDPRTGK